MAVVNDRLPVGIAVSNVAEEKDVYNIVTCVGDYIRGLDWLLNLLTTYRSLRTSYYSAVANSYTQQ